MSNATNATNATIGMQASKRVLILGTTGKTSIACALAGTPRPPYKWTCPAKVRCVNILDMVVEIWECGIVKDLCATYILDCLPAADLIIFADNNSWMQPDNISFVKEWLHCINKYVRQGTPVLTIDVEPHPTRPVVEKFEGPSIVYDVRRAGLDRFADERLQSAVCDALRASTMNVMGTISDHIPIVPWYVEWKKAAPFGNIESLSHLWSVESEEYRFYFQDPDVAMRIANCVIALDMNHEQARQCDLLRPPTASVRHVGIIHAHMHADAFSTLDVEDPLFLGPIPEDGQNPPFRPRNELLVALRLVRIVGDNVLFPTWCAHGNGAPVSHKEIKEQSVDGLIRHLDFGKYSSFSFPLDRLHALDAVVTSDASLGYERLWKTGRAIACKDYPNTIVMIEANNNSPDRIDIWVVNAGDRSNNARARSFYERICALAVPALIECRSKSSATTTRRDPPPPPPPPPQAEGAAVSMRDRCANAALYRM